jgi:NTE family protein
MHRAYRQYKAAAAGRAGPWEDERQGRPLRALVLSAGGTFGAYHAGAWQALEEAGFRPDIVAGASVGALEAALIARGCTAAQLSAWWRDPRWNVFRWNWPPRVWGLLDPRRLEKRVTELCERFSKPLPGVKLLVTLTELPGAKICVKADEEVTATCLLASCAIPLFYPPVKIDGRWYCDGGVFCRLPLGAAAAAGAAEIVAIDPLAAPPSRVLRAALGAACAVREAAIRQRDVSQIANPGVRVLRIEPSRPLGRPRDMLRWNPGQINQWIEAGYRDAVSWLDRERASQAKHAQPINPRAESSAPIKTERGR